MFKALFVLLAVCLSSLNGFADEAARTEITVEKAAGKHNKVDGDLDQEITNNKLRADSGSKSKFSGSLWGGYTGGSLSHAFGTYRPALSGEPGQQTFTSLDLGLNARYRRSKNDSFTLGTMFGFVTPIQGRVTGNDAININDPMLGYNRAVKFGGVQTVTSLIYMYGTSISSRDIDLTHQGMVMFNAIKPLQNGFSVGVGATVGYYLFDSKAGSSATKLVEQGVTDPGYYGGDHRTQWNLSLNPTVEYTINDKVSARTVFGYFNWRHLYGDQNRTRMLQTLVYQSVGLGIAVARDVYVYPNIQFVPDNIRSDFTNVSLTGVVNIF